MNISVSSKRFKGSISDDKSCLNLIAHLHTEKARWYLNYSLPSFIVRTNVH